MSLEFTVNCTLCQCLAGDRCTFHGVELDNPAYTVCAQFRLPGEDPDAMVMLYPQLQELSPDWVYEIDAGGEASPLVQVARRRRHNTRGTGKVALLNAAATGDEPPDVPEETDNDAIDRADRFAGAMLGLGLGDALGFPGDGRAPSEIEMIYGGPIKGLVARIGRRHTWPVGQVTKDTQLAICLAESLAEEEHLDLDDFAERLVRWLPSALRAGKSTTQAIEALAEGRHWAVTGVESNGCGSTVRIVPLALFRHTDYTKFRQDAILQSLVTHNAPKAFAGSVLFGTAIATLVNTPAGTLRRGEWLNLLERSIRGIDLETSAKLHDVAALLADDTSPQQALLRLKTGGYVLECLPSALYCFLYHQEYPERALLAGANGGFDATSVAAMAGALAGAYHGRKGLPKHWESQLPVAPSLIALANRLAALAATNGTLKA